MNSIPYFLCFAAGMIVDAVYHQRSKIAEQKLEEVAEEPNNEIALIPEEFMDDLRANGKAVWRRCR